MTASRDPQVLVIGAGPTGLATAAALVRQGVSVRIIDQSEARSDRSKALGVQAGTLECIAKALDPALSEEMIRSGQPAREAWIHIDDQSPIPVDFKTIPSRFPYILILAQSETERILEAFLTKHSVEVERRTELLEIESQGSAQGSKVVSKIKGPKGEETITSDFVIGCDGAHSTVRHQMGFTFEGAAYTGDFILGDVTLEWPWPYDSIHTFVSERGVIASFPMKGERKYRLILIPKEESPADRPAEISLEEFRSVTDFLSQKKIRVQDASWLTRFRVHHRRVEHFQKGRVFLAGDAAHIHSPAGGQGMNTGIQDAFNLAFKLKRYLDGQSDFESLRRYERERLPVAKKVLRGTDWVFKLALLPETGLTSFLRRVVVARLVRKAWIQKRVAAAISEMAVAQKEMARYPAER